MSVADSVNGRSPLKMQPNASFIIDEVDDADLDPVTPHALHNKRFTQKYLKSVFPSGFGVQNVRIGRDLHKDKHLIQTKQQKKLTRKSHASSLLSQGSPGVFHDERSVLSLATEVSQQTAGSVLTAPVIPSIMEMNKSLATNVETNKSLHANVKLTDTHTVRAPQQIKGTTGTKAPQSSFTDAFKGTKFLDLDNASMDDSLLEDEKDMHTDKGARDDYADVAGPYFTEMAQRPVSQPRVAAGTAPTSPPGQGRPDTTASLLKEVVVQLQDLAMPMTDDMSFSLTSLASTHTRVSGSGRSPPQSNKELVTRSQVLSQKPSGIDRLRDYISRARIPDIRSNNSTMNTPALLPSLGSSVRMATGTGGHDNNQPVHGVPPKAALGLFTPSASYVRTASQLHAANVGSGCWEMGAAVAGAAATRAGYGPVIQLPAASSEDSISSPRSPTGLTANKHNASGFLLSYDQWVDSGGGSPHAPKQEAVLLNSATEGGMRVEVKRSRQAPRTTGAADVEHAGGLGYQTYPTSIHVYMYSFQSVMRASAVSDMKPQYDFEMSREMSLDQLRQTVMSKAAQLNASELRHDEQKATAPVVFAYSGKGWKALERPLEWSKCKLQAISFLEKRRPLRLMYSIHPNEDLDEAFLYENRTTLAELRDFEHLGYEAPQSSAGFGLRQIQADGSPAASRQRGSSPESTQPRAATAPLSGGVRNFVHDGTPFDRTGSPSVRTRPQSPTVSRSSSRAMNQVTSAGGSAVSPKSKARPASSDFAKTKYQLAKTLPVAPLHSAYTPPVERGDGPYKVMSTEELNNMTGMLLGETSVPPPSLHQSHFPPPSKAESEKQRKMEPSGEADYDTVCAAKDDDDASVYSSASMKAAGSQRDQTRTNTMTLVDMKLMSKYGSPPKPSFGQKKSSPNRAGSPEDYRFGGKKTKKFIIPKQNPPMQKSKSLATLLLTHTPSQGLDAGGSTASSNTMSMSQLRDIQVTKNILANMSMDKQNRLCNELEGRLLLTKW